MVASFRSSAPDTDAATGAPQLSQKLAPAVTRAPHRLHVAASEPPQLGQNRALSVTEAPHAGHNAIGSTTAAPFEA